jgi:hypothetical protein
MSETEGPGDAAGTSVSIALADAQPLEPELTDAALPFHTVVVGASAGGVARAIRSA